ncbi:MAG: hypothetical protein A2Z34_09525 [Planctomycetes bacterium RBG_16_59_8]|nr:MAG: hypothetical protein A2Z34_09525 [Planctomycetes bacterium RBG_16_59_8]
MLDRYPGMGIPERFAERILERARREGLAKVRRLPRAVVSAAAAALFIAIFLLPTLMPPLDAPATNVAAPVAVDLPKEDAELVEHLDMVENIELARLLDVAEDDRAIEALSLLAEIAGEEDFR